MNEYSNNQKQKQGGHSPKPGIYSHYLKARKKGLKRPGKNSKMTGWQKKKEKKWGTVLLVRKS